MSLSLSDSQITIPQELLDSIVDHAADDAPLLRTLALVSRNTLVRSRGHLYSEVLFSRDHKYLPAFLALLDTPWTSFSTAVTRIHVHSGTTFGGQNDNDVWKLDANRIAANLPKLNAVWLTSMSWINIPPIFTEILTQCGNLRDLHLDFVSCPQRFIPDFFHWISKHIETVSFYGVQLGGNPYEIRIPGTTFKFKTLDTVTLQSMQQTWSLANSPDLDVTVDDFHVRLYPWGWGADVHFRNCLSSFISRFGHSFQTLSITLDSVFFSGVDGPLEVFEALDFRACINLKKLHIGPVDLNPGGLDHQTYITTVATALSRILHAHQTLTNVDELFITSFPYFHTKEGSIGTERGVKSIKMMPWADILSRLQRERPSNCKIFIRIGTFGAAINAYFEAARDAGLKAYEDQGLVSFQKYSYLDSAASLSGSLGIIHWREVFLDSE